MFYASEYCFSKFSRDCKKQNGGYAYKKMDSVWNQFDKMKI